MRTLTSTSLAALLGLGAVTTAVAPQIARAQISIGISVGFAPPPLPIYEQPPLPGYGYLWTPGFWNWDAGYRDYYWVPGTWVQPPRVGYLWTPGYWGFERGAYLFRQGYWGPTIGYYGGIDYGYGYTGRGYEGGYWRGGNLFYNRTVNNVRDVRTNFVYDRKVAVLGAGRVSFNGGSGGVQARPTPRELAVARGPRLSPTVNQTRQVQAARAMPGLRASVNHGAPAIAATPRPGVLQGPGVVTNARPGGAYSPPAAAPARRPPVMAPPQRDLATPTGVRPTPRQDQPLYPAPSHPAPDRRAPPTPQHVDGMSPRTPEADRKPPQGRPMNPRPVGAAPPEGTPANTHPAAQPAADRPAARPKEARPDANPPKTPPRTDPGKNDHKPDSPK